MNNIKFFITLIILIFSLGNINAQDELLSAKELLQKISDNFKNNTKDYRAKIKWIQGDTIQDGTVFFKNPQKMRINFNNPPNQVICTNGYDLWVYIPALNLTLHQKLLSKRIMQTEDQDEPDKNKKNNSEQKEDNEPTINPILLNPVGLDKFINDYAAEYSETKKKMAYKDGSMVYTLKLIRWKSSKNGFNVVFLTVQENGIIRKVDGITAAYRHVILEIDNIEQNIGVGDSIFNYQPPSHTTVAEDFITNQGR